MEDLAESVDSIRPGHLAAIKKAVGDLFYWICLVHHTCRIRIIEQDGTGGEEGPRRG